MIEFVNPFIWALPLSLIPFIIYFYRLSVRKPIILPTLKLIRKDDKIKFLSTPSFLVQTILRFLIVAMIVMIFSQPVLKKNSEHEYLVFILDTTYSSRNNIEKYIQVIKDQITLHPYAKEIRILDASGTEIRSDLNQIPNKLSAIKLRLSHIEKSFLSNISKILPENSKIFVLSDGQKSFLELIEKNGIKNYHFIKFSPSVVEGYVKYNNWTKILTNSSFHLFVSSKSNSRLIVELMDRKLEAKKIFESSLIGEKEFYISSGSLDLGGLYFIKSSLVGKLGTNNFYFPVYFSRDLVFHVNVPKELEKPIISSFKVLGINFDRKILDKSFNFIVAPKVNTDEFKNSIIFPYGENPVITTHGKFIKLIRTNTSIKIEPNVNLQILSINPKSYYYFPYNEVDLNTLGYKGIPVALFDVERNNIIFLIEINEKDLTLPIFIKDIVEFMLIDSIVTYTNIMETDSQISEIRVEDKRFYIFTPEKSEFSENFLDRNITTESNTNLSMYLFILLVLLLHLERKFT